MDLVSSDSPLSQLPQPGFAEIPDQRDFKPAKLVFDERVITCKSEQSLELCRIESERIKRHLERYIDRAIPHLIAGESIKLAIIDNFPKLNINGKDESLIQAGLINILIIRLLRERGLYAIGEVGSIIDKAEIEDKYSNYYVVSKNRAQLGDKYSYEFKIECKKSPNKIIRKIRRVLKWDMV